MRRAGFVVLLLSWAVPLWAHDIPNARVDRSIQVTLRPGRIEVDYEVGLSELTLTQDLRALIGTLPGGDRDAWFARYGREVGPLNAKGLLVTIDGEAVVLATRGHDLTIEQHPEYVFHFHAPIPEKGRLTFRDINYASSEGTSRLAIRGLDGVEVRADDLPGSVTEIPIRPVWQLSDAEERRTRQVSADYRAGERGLTIAEARPPETPRRVKSPPSQGLLGLLDRERTGATWFLWLVAVGLGAAHAIQPGHGKTLVAATVLGRRGAWWRGLALALITTATHFASVLAIAAALWATRSSRYESWNQGLTHAAGFTIAAIGLWRLGRLVAGGSVHEDHTGATAERGLIGIGIAGGIVPCWDAITLVLLAEALGRLPLALALLLGFSLGMAAVLVAVGWSAGRFRGMLTGRDAGGRWERALGIAGALVVSTIGVYLFAT